MKKILLYLILCGVLATPIVSSDLIYFRQDVSVGSSILPATNNAVDVGSTSKWFRDLYIGTSGSFYSKFTTTPTANRTITFPDASITVARSDAAQTLTGVQTISTTSGDIARLQTTNATGGYLYFYDAANSTTRGLFGYGSTLFTNAAISDVGFRTAGGFIMGLNGAVGGYMNSAGDFAIRAGRSFAFSSNAEDANQTLDTGLARNAAGVVEINNGTAGTLRDLKLRDLYFPALAFSTTAPTVTSAGTSPSITASNGTAAFIVNVGTGGTATDIVLAMPTANAGWICHANNITATAANRADQAVRQTASTTTSVTLQNQTVSTGAALAFTASDVVRCQCTAY